MFYDHPVLVVDPGMHTAPIRAVSADAAGCLAVTGSDDKTARVWSLTDGKLLRTIRIPAGPDDVGKIYAVAMSPDGALVAAGGWTRWTTTAPEESIYLFETLTGKMIARIAGVFASTHSLAFSPDGRYLAVGLFARNGLRIYDRDRQWSEVFRDTNYGDAIYGVDFAADGRLATTSLDGQVRLYDRDFKQIVAPRKPTGGAQPHLIAFSPDGIMLAVGYADTARVDLLDGHSLTPLPGPNVDDIRSGSLSRVTWSKDGRTLYAGGRFNKDGEFPVLAWAQAGQGERRTLPAGRTTVSGLAALPDGLLLVAAADPFLELLEPDGRPRWAHPSPKADFRDQRDVLGVDRRHHCRFWFRARGKVTTSLRSACAQA
jgi:WD40 repeat protein